MGLRKKIFLLGGTGFIGSALIEFFRSNADRYDVMMLIHRRIPFRFLENFNTYTGDLSNFDLTIIDNFKPDCIIHMARMSGSGSWGRYLAAKRGGKANQRIIDHLYRQESKPHVIYISGTLVYGDNGDQVADEDNPIMPTAYAREYVLAEKPWMKALNNEVLRVSILRPPWIIGKSSWFSNFYLNFIKKNGMVPIFGEGNNWMSVIDVKDCAGLIVHAIDNSKPGQCYNLGIPGYHLQQSEFAEKLSSFTGLDIIKLSKDDVIRLYNKTIYEAFSFSFKSETKHKVFINSYKFQFPTIDLMLKNNLY